MSRTLDRLHVSVSDLPYIRLSIRDANEYEKIGQRSTRRHYSPTRKQRAGAVSDRDEIVSPERLRLNVRASKGRTWMAHIQTDGTITLTVNFSSRLKNDERTIKIVTTTKTVTTRPVSSARICATVNSALSGHNTLMYHGEYPESYKPRRPMTAAGCSDVDAQPVQPRQSRRLTGGGNSSKQRLVEYLTPARARVTHST
ncbi:hypothetical protein J6590_002133 [Homalodisca vitripennis]|nr:hypothetical protein J6590_002133 [Homalodisca vitripennis]